MKMPMRNRTSQPLTLFVEPYCDEYEVGPGEEAIVTLEQGAPHSLDFHSENFVTLWDEGLNEAAIVEVVSKDQNLVVDALSFARTWLFHFGTEGEAAAKDINTIVEREEPASGYVGARFAAYKAFRDGYREMQSQPHPDDALPEWNGRAALSGAHQAGCMAAAFNQRVRLTPNLIELGEPPFDTDTARLKFEQADAVVQVSS